jgi:hypothetical protein
MKLLYAQSPNMTCSNSFNTNNYLHTVDKTDGVIQANIMFSLLTCNKNNMQIN